MAQASAGKRCARFAVFEVDLESGELRKHGLKIKLQQKPFQILALLIERPGEVLTRDELQRQLWPTDVFVDFESGLNNAVKKLRAALGDQPKRLVSSGRWRAS
jgi:DNA-binding winged helix-turn-helix (wHTH) protein